MKTKHLSVFVAAALCAATAQAQWRVPLPTPFRSDIQKVVADFPSQFATLRGEVLMTNPQTVEYASRVQVDKAEACVITRYSSNVHPVYSLQAVMLRTEDFAEAQKRYKWIFAQLKGMNVTYVVDKYTLEGAYDAPSEERKFATSMLALAHPPEALQKLRMEVSMQFEFPEWKVALTIFEKEKDDEDEAGSDY